MTAKPIDVDSAAADAIRLSLHSLDTLPATVERPTYDPRSVRIGVVHFGPGAFHRVHQAEILNRVLAQDPDWGICAVSLHSREVRDALAPQDGLYTLVELDAEIRLRVIGAIRECLVAGTDAARVRARLADAQVRLITLTVTEKGYCLDGSGQLDFTHPDILHDLGRMESSPPRSVIGWLLQALADRQAAGLAPPVIASCDNLTANGRKLRAAVLALAGRRTPALVDWITAQVPFPASMVDSITPATDHALRERVRKTLAGVVDAWPVQRERFSQWVLEDVPAHAGLPDLAQFGVQRTAEVAPWELAKLRLLNGAHSTLAWLGLLRGHALVRDAMADPQLAEFVTALMNEEIAPTLAAPPGLDLGVYADAVRTRFRNPAIAHQLAQIAWDSSQKLPFRLLGTVRDRLATGLPVRRLGEAIAGWLRFVEWRVRRSGEQLVDPLAAHLSALVQKLNGEAAADVRRWLGLEAVFGTDLPRHPSFVSALQAGYAAL